MKKRFMVLVLLTVIGGMTMGPFCWPDPDEGPKALQVIRAIGDLDEPDYVAVRHAIDDLTWLVEAPNVFRSVEPLVSILKNEGDLHDTYTRALAARALVIIGLALGPDEGEAAVDAVIDELGSGNSDLVRAASAKNLGSVDWEVVMAPLIEANENDPSPLVQLSACEALMMYSSGAYQSDKCYYEGAREEIPESTKPDLSTWAKAHVLLPLDKVDVEQAFGESGGMQ